MKQLLSLALAMTAAFSSAQVVMNGRTVSKDVRVINGAPYVSLQDMARALGMTVVKKGGRYTLVTPSGAAMLHGSREGKMAEEIYTGDWTFKVFSYQTVGDYEQRFGEHITLRPEKPGDELIVVRCSLKNGHKKPETIHFSNDFATNSHSRLTDTEAHSYPVTAYDVHHTYYGWATEFLPGATIDFALVFEVPTGTHPKDLVYSIFRYDDRGNSAKTTDVRVHLVK